MFKIKTSLLFIPIVSFALNCSLVREVKEYGGHYYAVTTGATTFLEAKKFAEDNEGYLAIPNSSGENSFIQSLIPKPNYGWIGIYDPDYTTNYCYEKDTCAYNDDRFVDIKGNGLSYTNWADKQPDNLVKHYDIFKGKQMVSPLGEHWVAISSVTGKWGDFGNHKDEYGNPTKLLAVIEFNDMPECYTPPSDVKEIDYTKPKCNTEIYDTSSSTTYTGKTIDCLQDRDNKWYCPSALAKCGEKWDYKDGYSVKYNNTFEQDTSPICADNEVKFGDRCYLDTNGDGKISSSDIKIQKVDYWTYTQKQDGQFYKYTEKYLNYSVKMTISWGGDDYHFGAKIKNRGSLMWSRIYVTNRGYCYGDDAGVYADGDINKVIWDTPPSCTNSCYYNGAWRTCSREYSIGHGDFTFNYKNMGSKSDWKSESNLANVVGDYFFIFFRDGGHEVDDRDYIQINFLTNNPKEPFSGATAVNPQWCPDGYITDSSHYCYRSPNSCPSGYRLSSSKCVKTFTYSYYEYLCSGTNKYGESYNPIYSGSGDCNAKSSSDLIDTNGDGVPDSCNSPVPPKNNCKAKDFICKPAPDRECVWVDSQWQCSPFPCFGTKGDYSVEFDDTPTGADDANNDGWQSDGSCIGQIYIFNGKDERCRSDDIAGGLTGGGCCNHDKVFLGLVPCKEEEKLLDKSKNIGKCHYIGRYCSKKIKLLGGKLCIQHKKTYCCFNSKLARIMNEQGREQLEKDWGSSKHPNCKGFKPEDFQKLDFSKMDLSEFYKDVSAKFSDSVKTNINTYIKHSVETKLSK